MTVQAPLPPTPATVPAPFVELGADTVELIWPGDDYTRRPEDRALALFPEDEWNVALSCPEARLAPAPPGAHRCHFEGASTLEVGGKRVWVAASEDGNEHEGMQFRRLDAVILAPLSGGAQPLATFTAVDLNMQDCDTSLSMRRVQVIDLDGDGARELCVESVLEEGVGLFPVMELDDAGQLWQPLRRKRERVAFRLADDRLALVRRADLDQACPPRGYELPGRYPFAKAGAFRLRAAIQGDPPVGRCPKKGSSTCVPALCARGREDD